MDISSKGNEYDMNQDASSIQQILQYVSSKGER